MSQYPGSDPYAQGGAGAQPEGQSAATLALVFGLLGLFVLGIVFGPLAIWQANKAKAAGVTGGMETAGRVLGWISIALWVIAILLMIVAFCSIAVLSSS